MFFKRLTRERGDIINNCDKVTREKIDIFLIKIGSDTPYRYPIIYWSVNSRILFEITVILPLTTLRSNKKKCSHKYIYLLFQMPFLPIVSFNGPFLPFIYHVCLLYERVVLFFCFYLADSIKYIFTNWHSPSQTRSRINATNRTFRDWTITGLSHLC